jgi:cellulose biosynthesis protein BcsQ
MKAVVYNNKGGVGKSTLVSHTAFYAMERKVELTVIDADQQCNSMSWLAGHEWDGSTEYETGTVRMTTDGGAVGGAMTIVDAPPSFTFVENHPEADIWIIPVGGRFSVTGAMNVIDQVRQVKKKARVVLVANMCDPNTKFGRLELDEINKLNIELFKIPIPRHDIVRKAEMAGQAAWSLPYGIRANAAQNLRTFADWMVRGCPDKGVYD